MRNLFYKLSTHPPIVSIPPISSSQERKKEKKKKEEGMANEKNSIETMKVKVTNKSYVKPDGKKVGRQECQLTTFDLPYLAFFYNQKLLFYKGGVGFDEAVLKLKDGLRVVLEEFWPLAGRLAKDEEGVFKVELDDDADADEINGVQVLEAAVDVGLSVEDLLSAELDMSLYKDFLPFNSVLNLDGLRLPLLSVQLTKLRDGLVMGCAFNHAVLDGTSTWHFMLSWAEACSGLKSVQPKPIHDRAKARSTRVKLDLSRPPAPTEAPNGNGAAPPPPPLREKVFHFTESAVEKIKSRLDNKYSTFQSLSVHIWTAVSAARQLKPEDPTVFTIFADCRKRIDPPMPESYFGNLIQAVFTGTAAGLLLANPREFGADLIRKAIEAHDAKEIERRNKEWEEKPIIFQFKDAGPNCVAVGSSPRFKVYDVDFGFGAPASVRSGLNNRFNGMLYMYPGTTGGRSIDVEVTLDAMAMEKLEKDKEFLIN